MDREFIVRITKEVIQGSISREDIHALIFNYCIEHGKDSYKTEELINVLLLIRNELPYYIHTALDYYKRKFTICELYSAPKPNGAGGQELTLIKVF